MPYDEMGIGPAPCDEKCAQVGEENYHERAREESRRFIELIRKKLGPEPPGARLTITSNPHDFGTYLDVVCRFQEGDEEALAYALLCESEAPRTWQDDQPLVKRTYSVDIEMSLRLTLEVAAESPHMAEIRAKAQAREKVRAAGFLLDEYDEVVATTREVAHSPPPATTVAPAPFDSERFARHVDPHLTPDAQ